jgi:hypothetical protein
VLDGDGGSASHFAQKRCGRISTCCLAFSSLPPEIVGQHSV